MKRSKLTEEQITTALAERTLLTAPTPPGNLAPSLVAGRVALVGAVWRTRDMPARRGFGVLDTPSPGLKIVRMTTREHVEDDAARTANEQRREAPFGAPYIFVLVAVDGEDPSLAHRLTRPETWIGRGSECQIDVEDDQVSRLHCSVQVDGPICVIVDTDSRNGTRVNGRRIKQGVKVRLRHLDEIGIGTHRLLLLSGRAPDRPKPDA